jgi:hypothetical protein
LVTGNAAAVTVKKTIVQRQVGARFVTHLSWCEARVRVDGGFRVAVAGVAGGTSLSGTGRHGEKDPEGEEDLLVVGDNGSGIVGDDEARGLEVSP